MAESSRHKHAISRLLARRDSRTVKPVLVVLLALAVVFGGGTDAIVLSSAHSASDLLGAGQVLSSGESLVSPNGLRLIMQSNGDLVAYDACNIAFWQSQTYRDPVDRGDHLIMQRDGNLVIYSTARKALWASGTAGRGGTHLVVRTNDDLVIYTPHNTPVWSSKTSGPHCVRGPGGPPGRRGPQGPRGRAGANGNTILHGSSLPTTGLGANGDFYLDTATESLYGPKTAGSWPTSGTSLVGPEGLQGNPGNTILSGSSLPTAGLGANGDFYLDTATESLYGPKAAGSWPTSGTSLVGPQGLQGNTGPTGPGAQLFNTSGTYGPPSGVIEIEVKVWGAGGGGGSGIDGGVPGSGGGGGAFVTVLLPVNSSACPSGVKIKVGAGGNGATPAVFDGTSGSTTQVSCGSLASVTLSGGGGGAGPAGGVGGTASFAGDANPITYAQGYAGTAPSSSSASGNGGNDGAGFNGGAGSGNLGIPGLNGGTGGGGGGGGGGGFGILPAPGGNGGNGLVIVVPLT